MTTYEFEFDLEEFVWTMVGSKAKQVQIQGHKITASIYIHKNGNPIYMVNCKNRDSLNPLPKHPHELFKTKPKLLDSL